MYRIVDMREATSTDQSFCVWDTVTDSFLQFRGQQVFDGRDEFLEHLRDYIPDEELAKITRVSRVLDLLPDWCKNLSPCADCGSVVGQDDGPPDGWQLEDGRTVCHACCVADTKKLTARRV